MARAKRDRLSVSHLERISSAFQVLHDSEKITVELVIVLMEALRDSLLDIKAYRSIDDVHASPGQLTSELLRIAHLHLKTPETIRKSDIQKQIDAIDKYTLPYVKVEFRKVETKLKNELISRSQSETNELPNLGKTHREILQALYRKKAFDFSSMMTTDEVAKVAEGAADGQSLKHSISLLKKLSYIDTKRGRNGGCWLTMIGYSTAEQL